MRKLNQQILYGLIGATGGLAGIIPLSRCGGNCTACFGCAGVGLGILLILTGQRIWGGKEESHKMGSGIDRLRSDPISDSDEHCRPVGGR